VELKSNKHQKSYAQKSTYEEEFELEPYNTLDDYDEMAVQWGYVILFIVAFPLAPFCALVNNYLEIRLDAKKLVRFSQRPAPAGATGIGTWFDILTIISFISVVVNIVIVTFDTALVDDWSNSNGFAKAWVFIIVEHIIIVVKFLISYMIADVPPMVQANIERQAYLVDVLINDIAEENDDLVEKEIDSGSGTKSAEFDYAQVSPHVPDPLYPSSMNALSEIHF